MTWLERHVVEQDKVMLAMGDELRRLRAELDLLRRRLASGIGGDAGETPDERPPHY